MFAADISSKEPTTTMVDRSNMLLDGGPDIRRILFNSNFGKVPNNAIIDKATIKLMQYNGYAGGHIAAHRLDQAIPQRVTWDTSPRYNPTPATRTAGIAGSYVYQEVDVTPIVQEFVDNRYPNYGIMLKNESEIQTNSRVIYRPNDPQSHYRPTLVVDYTIPSTNKKQVEHITTDYVSQGVSGFHEHATKMPDGAIAGDYVFVYSSINYSDATATPENGWSILTSKKTNMGFSIYVFYKKLTGNDLPLKYTTGAPASTTDIGMVYRNVKSIKHFSIAYYTGTHVFYPEFDIVTDTDNNLMTGLVMASSNSYTFNPMYASQMFYKNFLNGYSVNLAGRYLYQTRNLNAGSAGMTTGTNTQGSYFSLVLEPMSNTPPTVTLTFPSDNQTLVEGSTYKLEGTVSDADVGNVLSVKYSIAGGPTQSIPVGTTDGVNLLSFSKTLTYSQGRFWEGQKEVSGLLPTETTSIQVWAYDGLDDSAMVKRNFTIQQEDGKLYVPVNVVSSAFLVSKMARPVRLSNGWLVGAVHQSGTAIRVYKSQNNGNTWLSLTDVTNANPVKFALTCKGTRVYVLTLYNSYTSIVHFDVIAPHNQLVTTVDTMQGPSGGGSIFTTPDGTNLWWATSGTTAIYPYSNNIRAGSVPILQDGTLGKPSTVHQLGIQNNSSSNLKNPTVATLPNGSPCIIVDWTNASTSLIFGYYWNGTAFGSKSIFTTNVPQTQSSPDVCTTPNGKLHVSWHGTDSSDTVNPWIRYSNSVDGANWLPTPKKLVTGRNASITSDKNGKLIITYEDGGYIKRIESSNEFTSFSGPFVDGKGTNPATCYDQSFQTDFSIPSTFYQAAGEVKYRGVLNLNKRPVVTLDTPDNQTLTENSTLQVVGQSKDEDAGNVITVWYKINKGPVQAAASSISDGSTPILFDKSLTYRNKRIYLVDTDITGVDLAENTDHHLIVWAEDNKQGESLEVIRNFKVVWNRPPVIDGEDKELGVFIQPPTVNYSATDPEGNTFTFSEYLNGKQIRSFTGVPGQQYTFEISYDAWLRLKLDVQHQIKIVATDRAGISSERIYTFTRTESHIEFKLNFNSPDVQGHFILDGMPQRVLVTLEKYIPEGASIESVKVCNNALDDVPTWEDCTGAVKGNRGYLFTNKTKTAANWAINLWVVIAKGTATERVRLNGYGGAFD
nr:DNRLRE domain-containing protein [Brevibacillus sp. HB1.4B]